METVDYFDDKLHLRMTSLLGGSNGIGHETALDLAGRGAEVVIASRNRVKVCLSVADSVYGGRASKNGILG